MALPAIVWLGGLVLGAFALSKDGGAKPHAPHVQTQNGVQYVRRDLVPALFQSLTTTSGDLRGSWLLVLSGGSQNAATWAAGALAQSRAVLINIDGDLPGELLAVPFGTEKGAAAPGSRWAVLLSPGEPLPAGMGGMGPPAAPLPSVPGFPLPSMPSVPAGTVPATWSPGQPTYPGEGPVIEPPPPPPPPQGLPSVPFPTVPGLPSLPGMPAPGQGPGAATMPLPPGDPLANVPEPLRSQVLNAINDPMVSPQALRALADQLRPTFPAVAAMLEQAAHAKEASEKARAASEGRLFTVRGSNGIAVDLPTTVAKHYTGDANRWKEILASNPELKPKPAPDGSGATWVDGWNVGKVVVLPAAWGNLIAKGLPPALALPKSAKKQPAGVVEAAKRELRARGLNV